MSRNFELLQRLEQEKSADGLPTTQATGMFAPQDREELPVAEPRIAEPRSDLSLLAPLQGMVAHEIAKLIERLFLSAEDRRSVVFSGVERRAGCTWLAAQGARLLANQQRGSVCLIDGNLRFPALHTTFEMTNHHGLADAVLDSTPVHHFIQPLPIRNLWLLSSGSAEKSEAALLASEALRRRILEARKEFDFVLVDSPALNTYGDGLRLGAACNGLALVLKANSSRKETAQRILMELQTAKVCLFGAILNQRTFPVPEAIYSRL